MIDQLFKFILWLTGVVFIVTEVALFWFMWKYDAQAQHASRCKFTHGSHTLEVVWTILPAATLLFIAIYQMNAWADAKMIAQGRRHAAHGRSHRPAVRVAMSATRATTASSHTPDDIVRVDNDLHFPSNEEILLDHQERTTCCTASSCRTCG